MLELLREIRIVEEIYKNHDEFYELAEKYGFYTPWSIFEIEDKDMIPYSVIGST